MEKQRDVDRRNEEPTATGIRITLDWIEILDSMDLDTYGEFQFVFRVITDRRGLLAETRYPEAGTASISEHPAMNRAMHLDLRVFEGLLEEDEVLILEATGEDVDRLSRNDRIESYRREFRGSPSDWVGKHGPWDEGGEEERDPENLKQWRLGYRIEAVPADNIHPVPAEAVEEALQGEEPLEAPVRADAGGMAPSGPAGPTPPLQGT